MIVFTPLTETMIEEEGGKAMVFAADVTQAAACEAMVRAAVDAFGTVDILVNNIGLASPRHGRGHDRGGLGPGLRHQPAHRLPRVQVRGAGDGRGGGGAVVNVASISALRGDGTVAYSAAKGGLIAMTVDMAYSHGRQGIRVNAVAPGHITTPMVMSVSAPGPAPSS